jgi:16S rRNA (guanine(966)-N(2))-methyltransferase RsmD
MGFEALSRGAARAVLCDRDAEAVRVIRQNAEALGVTSQARVLRADWRQALKALAAEEARFGLIFLDPPYAQDPLPILQAVMEEGLLERDGLVVLEHDAKMPPQIPPGLSILKSRAYGHTGVSLIVHVREEP